MDTALKHRLTGAVILVFLAVLLLPELLTGRGMNAEPATAARASGELRRVEIDLGGAPVPLAPPPASDPPVQLPTPQLPVPEPEPEPEPQPQPEPQAEPPPRPAASGSYFVQVGVFSNAASAERVARRLREQGFSAAVSRYSTGQQMYRVRVGPQPDRAAARQVVDRLEAIGQKSPFIVAPDR